MKDSFQPEFKYMQRALEIARMGMGNCAPNPMVGSVVVYNDTIIGEGYHRKYGEAHAEVNAISMVKDKTLLEKATIYVTLEPCSHYGKTPPCAKLIIDSKIPRVVVGTIDIFSEVASRGIKMMQDAGIEVYVGFMNDQCIELNRRFFTFHQKKRPYIILKWAESIDHFIDIEREIDQPRESFKISNQLAHISVHKIRSDEMAIAVGRKTVENDNPSLNMRSWRGTNQPLRITVDRELTLNNNSSIFDGSIKTIVYTSKYKSSNNNVIFAQIDFEKDIIPQIVKHLHSLNIQSLIVEGGAYLINSFVKSGVWDEARRYTGNSYIEKGVAAPKLKSARLIKRETLNDTLLEVFRSKNS